jgi:hypothetical protein
MFPLDFPLRILGQRARYGEWVLDPFCGRGTTNYAARLLGLPSFGIDSSPIAAAMAEAKLVMTSAYEIEREAHAVLEEIATPRHVPSGEFWEWAYHPRVLVTLCRFREGLARDCWTDARKALRALFLGALHGPVNRTRPSYLSNQSTRTFAPKPAYSVRFWRSRGLFPPLVDVMDVIRIRAERYYGPAQPPARGRIALGDSREEGPYSARPEDARFGWVITSPPYYGMRSYIPDQWLRSWFLGGTPSVDYSTEGQLGHGSPEAYVDQLAQVWQRAGAVSLPGARLVVRFGGIRQRNTPPLPIILRSLQRGGWRIQTHRSAGDATAGRRQALHFGSHQAGPLEERDVWAVWEG